MTAHCYSPHPKEFYTVGVFGPGNQEMWLWNLTWLVFPVLDTWEEARTDEDRMSIIRSLDTLTVGNRASRLRDHEPTRPVMLALDQHPEEFIKAFEMSDIDIGSFIVKEFVGYKDDPDSVIITRAKLAAARIDGEKAPPSVRQEGNVIHAQFGKRSSA